ncbi:cytochrome bc complex cytochrome b subunit [candidate division KSB1 bacterium]|nr:cytochrome bc complex cytochrome b subunit [candidate division KSB1 bacterium]NIR68446.1 cytochrome bc complex cytochrome b subunit [candidate division KSB1 bacterium]NIS22678.1 cytochrome bc complex cytochrome b subunit [candidate division KSB1 bacterium]NIT72275.1 cytochrome bc complex cytochrome b subunit [candidate division KSB1 bacterium]NIU28634.1 cytochrome bc complex cytochrome b subunit [candidate division KSB1 bacterium]
MSESQNPQVKNYKRGRVQSWLEERYDLSAVEEFVKKKEVPISRHSIWYYFGGITLFFFIIQVVTGILLLLYYRPTAEAAFESVQFIMTEVRFGWLIRSIHSWSANLMIAAAFVHLFSVFFLKAYRKPRELTWVSGALLFFLSLGFGFSGYLLPWNELAFFATKVGTEIVAVVPLVGDFLLKFLRGGEDVTGATLTRFFGFHVAVLPMISTVLLVLHLWFVQKQGMSVPPSLERKGGPIKVMPFFPNFLMRDLLGWTLALAALAAIAALFPWELGVKADPFAPAPAGIKPEWYFVFMFQTLKFIPAKVLALDGEMLGVLAFGVIGVLFVLVPFLDKQARMGKTSRAFSALGVLAVIYILAMTIISYAVPQTF